MPKRIPSHGISPILYALGNEELEHIQYKQIHAIKQAQMAETFRDYRQQKAIETDLLLFSKQNKSILCNQKYVSNGKVWMNCNIFILQKISVKYMDYMEMLSSKVSPQQHAVLHLTTYRISFR